MKNQRTDSIRNEYSVVDFFCGIGGLSYGFARAGFDVAAGIDADASCKYAFETGVGGQFVHNKLEDLSAADISALFRPGKRWILAGCAPCQPFSAYASAVKKRQSDRWRLLYEFSDRIRELSPDVVTMENVPRLASFDGGRVFRDFVTALDSDYTVSHYSIFCPDYGVPQNRRRLVLFASRFGRVELLPPTHAANEYRVVRDAIGDLPGIRHGQADPNDPVHVCQGLSKCNLRRIRASRPGGTWGDWPDELVADCHKKESGRSYRNVYGRMEWDSPAPTITTGCFSFGRGRFGHPEQDRAISLREAGLLQTFPADYAFVAPEGKVRFHDLGRHIGNAVPVRLGEIVAQSIERHLEAAHA
jgi:DNA (cytosine-5)-methyltransferase 1